MCVRTADPELHDVKTPRLLTACALAAAFLLVESGSLAGQNRSAQDDYQAGLRLLADGDTAGAEAHLARYLQDHPEFGAAHLRLGSMLADRATEVERDFEIRLRARDHLEAALRHLGEEPEVLLQLALLFHKQQKRVDAHRMLTRAWTAAEARAESLPAEEAARLHFTLGRIYEVWWEDFDGLILPPPPGRLRCEVASDEQWQWPHYLRATNCPRQWAEEYETVMFVGERRSEDRERMIGHFQRAFELDPGQVEAAVRLLGHLADADDWERYQDTAYRLLGVAPENPRAWLFLGLGLHSLRREAEAEDAFTRGVELLPQEDRRVFRDVRYLLAEDVQRRYAEAGESTREAVARAFFTATDPTHLTPARERLVEHYARVAWAELKFSSPSSDRRGWESERGQVWIRYGQPWRSYQCCYGVFDDPQYSTGDPGTRVHYWSYGPNGPIFTFSRSLTYRKAILTDPGKFLSDDLQGHAPQSYRSPLITASPELDHQVARFRGSEASGVRVELYGAVPLDSLELPPGARVESGAFVFSADYTPLWERRDTVSPAGTLGVSYAFELPGGRYRYALEARREAEDTVPRPVARSVGDLELDPFAAGRLSVSDLLLAEWIVPRTDSPRRRDELSIAPRRSTVVSRGEVLELYFEVYDLVSDSAGRIRYAAELSVEDAERRNVLERLVRAGVELVRGAREASVSWTREADLEQDDSRLAEYLRLDLVDLPAGEYRIRVRVRDLVTGTEAESERRFLIVQ